MEINVVVVGAVNHDLIATVERRPMAGETVLARSFNTSSGGKGANQAAAAARDGAATALIGCVGADATGDGELRSLEAAGIRTREVAVLKGVPTGTAMISVTLEGENSIVVAAGANAHLPVSHVQAALARLCTQQTVVVLQTEVSPEVIDAAASHCAERHIRVILNNGPCVRLSQDSLATADPLVVNETEAVQMLQAPPENPSELARALLRECGARSVVVTLGGRGAIWHDGTDTGHVPAETVEVVDTTGAGDTFIGTLAAALSRKESLAQACELASKAAAKAVTWMGARPR